MLLHEGNTAAVYIWECQASRLFAQDKNAGCSEYADVKTTISQVSQLNIAIRGRSKMHWMGQSQSSTTRRVRLNSYCQCFHEQCFSSRTFWTSSFGLPTLSVTWVRTAARAVVALATTCRQISGVKAEMLRACERCPAGSHRCGRTKRKEDGTTHPCRRASSARLSRIAPIQTFGSLWGWCTWSLRRMGCACAAGGWQVTSQDHIRDPTHSSVISAVLCCTALCCSGAAHCMAALHPELGWGNRTESTQCHTGTQLI